MLRRCMIHLFIGCLILIISNSVYSAEKRSARFHTVSYPGTQSAVNPEKYTVEYPFTPMEASVSVLKTPELKNMETFIGKYIHSVVSTSDISRAMYSLYWNSNKMVTVEEGFNQNTPFAIASLTKSFTAVTVMRLVELGTLELDEPVSTYGLKIDDPKLGKITVRSLLQHRSGIPYHRSVPAFPPYHTFIYSNFNYEYLAQLVSIVTKKSYKDAIESELFRPLGMSNSKVSNHHQGSSGIITTPHDMAIFACMLANGGSYNGYRVLSPETIREMLQPAHNEKVYDSTPYYAHGFRVETVNKRVKSFYHTGLWNDCYAEIRIFPKDNAFIVQMATPHNFRSRMLESYKSQTGYFAERYISRVSGLAHIKKSGQPESEIHTVLNNE